MENTDSQARIAYSVLSKIRIRNTQYEKEFTWILSTDEKIFLYFTLLFKGISRTPSRIRYNSGRRVFDNYFKRNL